MKTSNWKDTAELIGIGAIVASLIFVGLQLQQDQQIAEAQIYADSNMISIELAGLVNEDRDIWLRGLNDEELSPEDAVTFQNLFVAVRLAYGGIWQRSTRLDTRTTDSVEKQFAYLLFSYPGLRRVWADYLLLIQSRSEAYEGPDSFPLGPMDDRVNDILLQLEAGTAEPPEHRLFTPWF
jgi:hypothetical protein